MRTRDPHVGSRDDNKPSQIQRFAGGEFEPGGAQYLQKQVKDQRMRLLDLIKQKHTGAKSQVKITAQ